MMATMILMLSSLEGYPARYLIANYKSSFQLKSFLGKNLIAKINLIELMPPCSVSHQCLTSKKMIANTKDFRTITLRGLDEKPNIVGTMNEVMKEQGLKTGQAVIEFIINNYTQLQQELNTVKAKREVERQNYYKWSSEREDEIVELKQTIKAVKVAFQKIEETNL